MSNVSNWSRASLGVNYLSDCNLKILMSFGQSTIKRQVIFQHKRLYLELLLSDQSLDVGPPLTIESLS